MGSRVGTGVSPGESRARTGAAVGPGSISGLSRKKADQVLNRAERLRGDNLTPETVQIAYESFRGLPDRSGPGMKMFALPPSVRDKDLLTQQFIENIKKTDAPPSMTIPQLPDNPFPGYQFSPNLPSTPPPGLEPEEVPLPNTPVPGTPERNMMFMPFAPRDVNPVTNFGSGMSKGLDGILATLIQQGLLQNGK
jgi:hypothetical protein